MEDPVDSSELGARNFMEQEETSNLVGAEATPLEWTDEKHCLFLKSMESTFVDQMYNSTDMFGWHSHKSSSSGSKSFKQKQTSARNPSGQFKVLRDGFWSRVDFRKDEPDAESKPKQEFKVPLANPWIQHYRNSKVQSIRKFPSCAKAPLATSENQNSLNNLQLCSKDSIDGNTEGTDQNFNDEALEEEYLERSSGHT